MAESANSTPVPASRRGFLWGLTTLPLIGGSVALIGAPSAVAGTSSRECVDSYLAWLHYEQRAVHDAHYGGPSATINGKPHRLVPMDNAGAGFHFPGRLTDGWWERVGAEGIARAPVVLAAAGCDWREGGR